VFLAPQCTALRCPLVSALVVPVVRVPSCARGPSGVLFTARLHMYSSTTNLYYLYSTRPLTGWLRQILRIPYRVNACSILCKLFKLPVHKAVSK